MYFVLLKILGHKLSLPSSKNICVMLFGFCSFRCLCAASNEILCSIILKYRNLRWSYPSLHCQGYKPSYSSLLRCCLLQAFCTNPQWFRLKPVGRKISLISIFVIWLTCRRCWGKGSLWARPRCIWSHDLGWHSWFFLRFSALNLNYILLARTLCIVSI